MKIRATAALLAATLAASPALARQDAAATQSAPPMQPGGQPLRGPGAMGGGLGMLRMADTNGDGVVTRAEYQAAVDARFDRMDRNHDGILSPDEMPMRGGRPGGMSGGDVPPPPGSGASAGATGTPPAPPPPGMTRPPETRERYRAMAMRRFDRLDANHDGRIDQAEMAAAASMRPGRGGTVDAPPPPRDQ